MSVNFAEAPIANQRVDTPSADDTFSVMYSGVSPEEFIEFWERCLSWGTEVAEAGTIDDLEAGYTVLKPIPYEIKSEQDRSFMASFDEANIAITGADRQDAYQSLVAEILDTYDALEEEAALPPAAAAQFALLRAYVVKA